MSKVLDLSTTLLSRTVPIKLRWNCVDKADESASEVDPMLLNMMVNCPYCSALLHQGYVESTDELCDILN